MPSLAELESRLSIVEGKIDGAVEIPTGAIDINDTTITDKTGYCCFGIKSGINSGKLFVAVSTAADPTSDSDFTTPFIFRAI